MVPEGWRQARLGEVVAEFRGGGTPSREQSDFWGGDIPWASVKDLNGDRLKATAESITQEGLRNSSASRVPAGTVILATRMAVGKAVTAEVPLAINQDLKGLLPTAELFSPYLKAWLNWREKGIAALASGTTVKGIRLVSLRSLPLALPPLPEQRKIAAILSSVDDSIAVTRKVIEQTKRVKQGLLQTLMTRGIGHTRFKKTEIGEIPEGWEVASADDLCEKISVGIVVRPAALYVEAGVPCIRSANISSDGIVDDDWVWISRESSQGHAKSILRAGDVVVVRTGEPGVATVVPDWLDECNCVDIIFAKPRAKRLDPCFLALFLNSDAGRKQVLQKRGGLAQKHLNVGALKRMHVPVPSLREQAQIVARIFGAQEAGAAAKREAESLQNLKRGLMQDLLTGRVRVPLD